MTIPAALFSVLIWELLYALWQTPIGACGEFGLAAFFVAVFMVAGMG